MKNTGILLTIFLLSQIIVGSPIQPQGVDIIFTIPDVSSNANIRLAFNPNGSTLASGAWSSVNESIRLWDSKTGTNLGNFDFADSVYSLDFNPDGETLLSASFSAGIKLWNTSSMTDLLRFPPPLEGRINKASFSPDGRVVAQIDDSEIKLWNVSSGEEIMTISHTDGASQANVAFSPDGKFIFAGTSTYEIQMWDVETGAEIKVFVGHTAGVINIILSSDGTTMVTGSASNDGTIKVWNVSTGDEIRTLEGHGNFVQAVSFNSDESMIVSSGNDESIRIWDVQTGTELNMIQHVDFLATVVFNPVEDLFASTVGRSIIFYDTSSLLIATATVTKTATSTTTDTATSTITDTATSTITDTATSTITDTETDTTTATSTVQTILTTTVDTTIQKSEASASPAIPFIMIALLFGTTISKRRKIE